MTTLDNKDSLNPIVHLVSDQNGIYSHHVLAKNYPLFVSDGPMTENTYMPIGEWLTRRADMENETIETVFNPDNSDYCENIEYCEYHNTLAVKHENGAYWRIESHEGGLVAVNPFAIWDDENERYVLGARDNT